MEFVVVGVFDVEGLYVFVFRCGEWDCYVFLREEEVRLEFFYFFVYIKELVRFRVVFIIFLFEDRVILDFVGEG